MFIAIPQFYLHNLLPNQFEPNSELADEVCDFANFLVCEFDGICEQRAVRMETVFGQVADVRMAENLEWRTTVVLFENLKKIFKCRVNTSFAAFYKKLFQPHLKVGSNMFYATFFPKHSIHFEDGNERIMIVLTHSLFLASALHENKRDVEVTWGGFKFTAYFDRFRNWSIVLDDKGQMPRYLVPGLEDEGSEDGDGEEGARLVINYISFYVFV